MPKQRNDIRMDNEKFREVRPLASFARQCGRPEGMVIITALAVIQYWLVSLMAGGSYEDFSSLLKPANFSIIVMSVLIAYLLLIGVLSYIQSMTELLSLQARKNHKIFIVLSLIVYILVFTIITLHNNEYIRLEFISGINNTQRNFISFLYLIGGISLAICILFIFNQKIPIASVIFVFALISAVGFYASTYQDAKKNSYILDAKYCYWLYMIASSQPHLGKKTDPACLRLGITSRSTPLHLID